MVHTAYFKHYFVEIPFAAGADAEALTAVVKREEKGDNEFLDMRVSSNGKNWLLCFRYQWGEQISSL